MPVFGFGFFSAALLLASLLSSAAHAQLPRGLISVEITGLRVVETEVWKGERSNIRAEDDNADLRNLDTGLASAILAAVCPDQVVTGEGRFIYKAAGGAASDARRCELGNAKYDWQNDYQWTSTATWSGGRLTLNAQGSATELTLRGCSACGPKKIEISEQIVVRFSGRSCAIESFKRTIVRRSESAAGGETVNTEVTSHGAKTRCSMLIP